MCVSVGQACSAGISLAVSAPFVGATFGEASASPCDSGPTNVSATSFTHTFAIMRDFKPLAASGHGKIAAILPDTVSSTRYVEIDQPDLVKAMNLAGLSSSQYVVQNALDSDATQLTDAQTDIANGATVAGARPDRLRRRYADESLREVAWREGHRLRPPHPRRQSRRLRQLQTP